MSQEDGGIRLSHERKFVGESYRSSYAVTLLDTLLDPDGEHPANTVHSVYFDTPALDAYAEKADGDYLKCKVRMRWYGGDGGGQGAIYVENKYRVGGARHKQRRSIHVDPAWRNSASLSDGRWQDILADSGTVAQGLLPVVCITYERLRYRCPATGGRVAVDRDIRVERYNRDLFPLGVPLVVPGVVCEFKDAGRVEIPWLRHLSAMGFRLRSFSKYGEAIRLLHLGGGCA